MCASVHFRILSDNGSQINLVVKTKASPLKTQSIPHLELMPHYYCVNQSIAQWRISIFLKLISIFDRNPKQFYVGYLHSHIFVRHLYLTESLKFKDLFLQDVGIIQILKKIPQIQVLEKFRLMNLKILFCGGTVPNFFKIIMQLTLLIGKNLIQKIKRLISRRIYIRLINCISMITVCLKIFFIQKTNKNISSLFQNS